MGIRMRFLFTSALRLLSSFSGLSSILPTIFGPSSSGASILTLSGSAGLAASAGIISSGTTASTSGAFSSGLATAFFFDSPRFGRVEALIASRSILSKILGPCNSGASIFVISTSGSAGLATSSEGGSATSVGSSAATISVTPTETGSGAGAGAGCSSTAGSAFFLVSFLKTISSSSFFFLASPDDPLGISMASLFAFVALSEENSCCRE